MTSALFIAGDWGTSRLRLYLCEYRPSSAPKILDTRAGPGISNIEGDFATIFFTLVDGWLARYGAAPVILSGMVGSNIGWKEAPYVACPAPVQKVVDSRISFAERGLDISIMPGLSTVNYLGNPDLIRGEELHIYGWQQISKASDQARLMVLPGTHNKWVLVRDNRIETFVTALTGELFALLREHSVLIPNAPSEDFHEDVFLRAFDTLKDSDDIDLLYTLFATRSRQVTGKLSAEQSLSYLSGLLIGADVLGALRMFRKNIGEIPLITLLGEPRLTRSYALILKRLELLAECPDVSQVAVAGYQAIYQRLYIEQNQA